MIASINGIKPSKERERREKDQNGDIMGRVLGGKNEMEISISKSNK